MEKKIHLVFTLVMSAFMIFFMSLVVVVVNMGFSEHLFSAWMKSFIIAWVIGAPLMFVFAPIFRKVITKKITQSNG
jgi:positive regulator of sigma E activity